MRFSLVALTTAVASLLVACGAAPSENVGDPQEQDVKGCAALKVQSAAGLMPAGSASAIVGSFELLQSSRAYNTLTGGGSWSTWEAIDSGDVVFQTTHDALDGDFIMMTLAGAYESLTGGNRVSWKVGAHGLVSNNNDQDHEVEVNWWLNNHVSSQRTATFQISGIKATTCALNATSDTVTDLDRGEQARYRVRVKFGH